MELRYREIEVKGRGEWIRLYPLGDVHYGARTCDVPLWNKTCEQIASEPNAYWLGDYADLVTWRDKRFDPEELDHEIWQAMGQNIAKFTPEVLERFFRRTRPIMHKCLGLLKGNHEDVAQLRYQIPFLYEWVKDYKKWCTDREKPKPVNEWAEDLSYESIIRIRFRQGKRTSTLTIFAAHGAGGARTLGGKIKRIEDVVSWCHDADVYMVGHYHDEIVRRHLVLRVRDTKPEPTLKAETKLIMLVPSFMRTYAEGGSSYASKRLYSPSVLGPLALDILPFGRQSRGNGKRNEHPIVNVTVTNDGQRD